MFKLVTKGTKHRITFGRGTGITANNSEEAINVLKHYFMKRHNKEKCPACRDLK